MSEVAKCELCGERMPPGEEMFKFHGYSGPCPKEPKADPVKLLSDYAKRITDPMFDVCCDSKLTPGQTLTVLQMAKEVLDTEIARWQETVERQTK